MSQLAGKLLFFFKKENNPQFTDGENGDSEKLRNLPKLHSESEAPVFSPGVLDSEVHTCSATQSKMFSFSNTCPVMKLQYWSTETQDSRFPPQSSDIFSNFLFTYFWLCWVSFVAHGLSLVAESGGHPLVVVRGFLIVVASLVAEHGLQSAGSAVVVHRLSCPVACEIFPDQGSNPCSLHWRADS